MLSKVKRQILRVSWTCQCTPSAHLPRPKLAFPRVRGASPARPREKKFLDVAFPTSAGEGCTRTPWFVAAWVGFLPNYAAWVGFLPNYAAWVGFLRICEGISIGESVKGFPSELNIFDDFS